MEFGVLLWKKAVNSATVHSLLLYILFSSKCNLAGCKHVFSKKTLSKVDKPSWGLECIRAPVWPLVLHYEWGGRSPARRPGGWKPNTFNVSFPQHVAYCLLWKLWVTLSSNAVRNSVFCQTTMKQFSSVLDFSRTCSLIKNQNCGMLKEIRNA